MRSLVVAQTNQPFIDWSWLGSHLDDIWTATLEHLTLVVITLVVGFILSAVLALIALRWHRTYGPITWVTGTLYTIPSLALFTFLVPVFGLSTLTAEIALVSYTLLILVRNMVAGINGVPDHIIESSRGMGMSERQTFVGVQLPLAIPTIIAGVRIAAVTTIGLVTVTALIGQGGYGLFINRGIQRQFLTEVLAGTMLSVLMAVVFDAALIGIEHVATPWSRRRATR